MIGMKYTTLIFLLLASVYSLAQDRWQLSLTETCETYMTDGFKSDGQFYQHTLNKGEVIESKIALMSGNTYRVAVCGATSKKIEFTLVDIEGNVLFTNSDFDYAPYWDFEITHTIECKLMIENKDTSIDKEKTILLISYKQ